MSEDGDIMESVVDVQHSDKPATPKAPLVSDLNVTNKCYMFDYGKQMSRVMSLTEEQNDQRKESLIQFCKTLDNSEM